MYVIAPKGFFPVEDTGFVWVNTEAAQDISYDAMLAKQKRAAEIVLTNPAVATVFSSIGGGTVNTGRMMFGLKPRGERPPVFDVIQELRRELSSCREFQGLHAAHPEYPDRRAIQQQPVPVHFAR